MGERQDVGRVLKRLREEAGFSQRELADRLGVQQPAIARWEAGGVNIPLNRIEEIVACFGYGIEYDLKAIPLQAALNDGVSFQLVRRRTDGETQHDRLRARSGNYEFVAHPDSGWYVEMSDITTGDRLVGALGVYPSRIECMVAHPDGVLVRYGTVVGKVVPSAKSHLDGSAVFAFFHADQRDLELAGVADDPDWKIP